jgi:nucleoside-diphosphate-sugar epimerase
VKVVITGGTGFIGLTLARRIQALGRLTGPSGKAAPVDEILLFDVVAPAARPLGLDNRVKIVAGQIAERDQVAALIDRDDVSVFHLASVVSGEGEQDFDLAMRVNLDGTRHLLEACRARGSRPRLVFTSSIAVFGGDGMPSTVGDAVKQTPQTTYGVTKAIGELLVNDYSRKGFLDGRSARLPTVIVRPGKPNKAASSFASGVFREPLNGVDCILPVAETAVMPVLGYRTTVENLIRLHELDGAKMGNDRAVSLPSLDVTVAEMIASLKRVAGNRHLGEIRVERDPFIERIVAGWPVASDSTRARALGLVADESLDPIVRGYIEDFLPA